MKTYQMLVGGEWVSAASGKTFDVMNPATDEVVAKVPEAGPVDVDKAVKAARPGFEGGWRDATAKERGRVLVRLAEKMRAELPRLAELETVNSGKPIVESEFDLNDVATCFEYYGGLATKLHGEVLPVPDNAVSMALREPIGVARQIIPWDYPPLMGGWKPPPPTSPRRSLGIKPAEQTPLTLLEFARFFEECGLPKGVVNVVTGFGETGAAIVSHGDVDKIAFTGSLEVGKLIMKNAAESLKKVSLELGGKSPNIFFADSDFEAAVDGALFGVFINQGEVCSAGSRVLVQRPIYKKMLDAMVAKAKTIKIGPGLDRANKMGPVVSKEQLERVTHYQAIGKKEAKVAVGGGRATGAGLERGYFVEPTIFYDVENSATIAREA